MKSFAEFLNEDAGSAYYDLIMSYIDKMSDEDIDFIGSEIYLEFYEQDPEFDIDDMYFDKGDLIAIVDDLGSDFYSEIYSMIVQLNNAEETPEDGVLPPTNFEDDMLRTKDIVRISRTDEKVKAWTSKNIKHKKRKFVNKKRFLKQTKMQRRAERLKNKSKLKRYRAMNKIMLAKNAEKRADAIKSGKHKATFHI